jgi:hypothetical protein
VKHSETDIFFKLQLLGDKRIRLRLPSQIVDGAVSFLSNDCWKLAHLEARDEKAIFGQGAVALYFRKAD